MSNKTTAFSNDSLTFFFQALNLLDPNEVLELEAEIEILREQVESFKQLLERHNQKIQEITQELMHIRERSV